QRGIEEGYKPSKDANLELYDAAVLLQGGLEGEIGALDTAAEKARQKEEATKKNTDATLSSADAFLEEADAAAELTNQLSKLVDKINEANGVGQDAVSTNARYQSALAGLSAQVEKNGTSLDQATEA